MLMMILGSSYLVELCLLLLEQKLLLVQNKLLLAMATL